MRKPVVGAHEKEVDVKVADVMTKDPVTVGPDVQLKDVADILVARGVSGLPVVGTGGEPLGVVSEADLLLKGAGVPSETRGALGWRLLFDRTRDGEAEVKARLAARTAGEAMTSPAITIGPEQSVSEAARTMIENRVNRLPVVDDGKVIGIVTRADLVRNFLRSDQQIRREIEHDIITGTLWAEPSRVQVGVSQGEVTLTGRLDTKLDAELLPRLVWRVPGVVSVAADLTWESGEQPLPKGGRHRIRGS
jgi:CBS domain-containing protein